MSDYTGVTNQLGNAVGLPFSSFSVEEPGMIDLAFAADDLTRMNDMFWLDGIRQDSADWTDGDGAVRWSNGFNVYVRPFRAHVNGTIVFAPQTALIIEQEPVSERVDSIIIRRDYTLRKVDVMVLKGTSGSTNPPTLAYNAFGIVEYEFARVYVNNGMVALSQADITDMRTVLVADFLTVRPTSADVRKIPMVDSRGGFELSDAIIKSQQIMHVQDQKAYNINGGTATGGTSHTRDLNTIVTNTIPGASLSNNQITLPAGTYFISGSSPAYGVGQNCIYLYNVSKNEIAIQGTAGFSQQNYGNQTSSYFKKKIAIDAPSVFEVRHWVRVTAAGDGLGVAINYNSALTNVYTDVTIQRMA